MKRMRSIDIVLSALVVVLLSAALLPALGRVQRSPADARCQSNLHRWGEAMALYLSDHGGLYPTNRIVTGGSVGVIASPIPLSRPDPIPPATEPPVFEYGLNWVEALYPHIKVLAAGTGQDWKSFRRCPNATDNHYPTSSHDLHWSMSYVFNGSIVETPLVITPDPRKLMVIREYGRLTVATLRPTNNSTGNNATRPMYPFLNKTDAGIIGGTADECQLHGGGSYILFADGHVRHFTLDYYPEYMTMTAANAWDPVARQWYNYYYANPTTELQKARNKSIAITP